MKMSAKALKTIILMFPVMVLIALSSAIVFADSPQVGIYGQTYANEGDAISFKITTYLDDQYVDMSYLADSLPEGAVFDGQNFTWNTNIGDAGEYYLNFTAAGDNYSISKQVMLKVVEINPQPGVCYFGDTNGDCITTSLDLLKVKSKVLLKPVDCTGTLPGDCSGLDMNGDGYVGMFDERILRDMVLLKNVQIDGAPAAIVNVDYPNV